MTTAITLIATAIYLIGCAALATAWAPVIRDHPDPRLHLLIDTHPTAVCLLLAILTVAWPALLIYLALEPKNGDPK